MQRRTFLQSMTAAAAATVGLTPRATEEHDGKRVPRRSLGQAGWPVSIIGLGGQSALERAEDQAEAVRIIETALEMGVNYFDTASLYGNGQSERILGEVLQGRWKDVILATKTHDRSYDGTMRLLERSLRRLRTDHIDIMQLHNIKTEFDVGMALSRDGAVRALENARRHGVIRCIGITGHKDPLVLRRAIREYPFDTALIALNAADVHRDSFISNLLPELVEQGIGIVAMKVACLGRIFRTPGITTMREALSYVLSLPVACAVVGISRVEEMIGNAAIARDFVPMGKQEMHSLEQCTQAYAHEALWYRDHM